MEVYRTDQVRNVILLGHSGSGKTTLAEGMAYLSGITSRLGSVSDGNTVSDYDKEEIKRKFSVSTSVIPIEWEDAKVNILDTPGLYDFVGEREEAASAADAAIIVVSGKSGVEAGTRKAWEICERYHLPRMIFVTDMDIDDVSYRKVVEALQELYGKKIAPLHMPIRENGKFVGYVNIVKNKGRRYIDKNRKEECPIPEYLNDYLSEYRDYLLEAVAESSEEFMDRYFNGDEFSTAEISSVLKTSVSDGELVPVCMGAPINLQGVKILLDDIVHFFPSPDKRTRTGLDRTSNAAFDADYDFRKMKTATVWKTIIDPFIGKYSLVKICSGVLKSGDNLYNVTRDSEEKFGKLYVLCGNKPAEVEELHAGDIGAIAKLGDTNTGDSFAPKAHPVDFGMVSLSKPYTVKAYSTENKGDLDRVSQGLSKLAMEDLTIRVVNDSDNHQSLLYGIGDMHLDVVTSKLEERYHVKVDLSKPKIAFKETIRKSSDVESKYKKQSGGHGQYGHVKMRFSPSGNLEEAYEFAEEVVGGAVPKNYFPAVEKGIMDSVLEGPLAGYPVVGVKAVLYDGSYHPVDSSEMAFKTAASMAFKDGFMKAQPILLEPIVNLKVTAPDSSTGDVMGDLNKRRGRVLGMNPDKNGDTIIEAEVPESELYGYSSKLRSMTAGEGVFEYSFVRYEQTPSDIQNREVEERKKEEA